MGKTVMYKGYIIVEGDWTDPDPDAGPDWLIFEFNPIQGKYVPYSGHGVFTSLHGAKAEIDADIDGIRR